MTSMPIYRKRRIAGSMSLMELIIVLHLLVGILSICTYLTASTLKEARIERQRTERAEEIDGFSQMLEADLACAAKTRILNDGNLLIVTNAGIRIFYELRDGFLVRSEGKNRSIAMKYVLKCAFELNQEGRILGISVSLAGPVRGAKEDMDMAFAVAGAR